MEVTCWNTWDVYHLMAMTHLPSGLRATLKLEDPVTGERVSQFDWRNNLRRLGPHAPDGSYQEIQIAWRGETFVFEAASERNCLACRLSPIANSQIRASMILEGAWGKAVESEVTPDGLTVKSGGQDWRLRIHSPDLQCFDRDWSVSLAAPLIYSVAPEQRSQPVDPLAMIERQRAAYAAACLRTAGWLEDAADGMTRALLWITIWEPSKGRMCTPVSREWCVDPNWGGYVLFDWDTFFAALMAGLEDPGLAAANVRSILQEVTPCGFVPNFGSARVVSYDRSQPPVGAYCVLKLFRASGLEPGGTHHAAVNLAFLAEVFPALLRWHRWWLPNRDGNHDGLLEWGSDPLPNELGWEVNTLRAAMYESGLDNSPMYDEAEYDTDAHTMKLADVGLNALYALDAWALGEIARELGFLDTAGEMQDDYQRISERINEWLWNEEAGIYQNRHWDGRFSAHLSPTNFYPLLAGIVPPERAKRMVTEHLLNEDEFWGRFVIPSISRNDPGYHRNEILRDNISQTIGEYWRGRIWGPMNFLVCEGLRRAGFNIEAYEFARKGLSLYLGEWQAESHVHENYHDISGDGDDVQNSNPLYHWGALLAYLAIQEVADAECWDGWRFGCPTEEPADLDGLRIAEGQLRVQSGLDGLHVNLNGQLLLSANGPAVIRGFKRQVGRLSFRMEAQKPSLRLVVGCLPANRPVTVTWNSPGNAASRQSIPAITNSSGNLELTVTPVAVVELSWHAESGGDTVES